MTVEPVEMQMKIPESAMDEINRIAATFDITPGDVIGRGLALVKFWASLMPNQSLATYNEDTGLVTRVECQWA